MVAFAFPPYNSGSGGLRAYNFYKYLPQYGWRAHVLTVKENVYDFVDSTFKLNISDDVTRVFCFDAKRKLSIKGRYPAVLAFPDRYSSWLPSGLIAGMKIVRKEPILALYSTLQIPTAHLIGLGLKKLTGLPWIAEFRDPWIEDYLPNSSSFRSRIEGRLEKNIVESADIVLLTTNSLRDYFLRRYKHVDPNRFRVIYNGFEENYFAHILAEAPSREKEYFNLIHAGAINGEFRNPYPVMKALSELISEEAIPSKELRLTFIGSGEYTASQGFLRDVSDLGLEKQINIIDRLPYELCIKWLQSADILLLLQYSQEVEMLIPAKTFEYLRIGNPILALADEGETKQLIESCNAGWAKNPDDIQGIKNTIYQIYDTYRKGIAWQGPSKEKVTEYSREILTGKLAAFLEELSMG